MKWITVVILCYNEEKIIQECLSNVQKLEYVSQASILISDGNSTDQTIKLIGDKVKYVVSEPNKAVQMNKAEENSNSEVLWFIHADMKLPKNALVLIKKYINQGFDGGGFRNVFDKHNEKIKRLGRLLNFRIFSNKEQSDKGFFYGDNGIFIKKKVLKEIGGIPSQEIMEDYELSIRLKKAKARMIKINEASIVVSSRRHIQTGFVKTRILWIAIRTLYKWGVSPSYLRKLYNDNRK